MDFLMPATAAEHTSLLLLVPLAPLIVHGLATLVTVFWPVKKSTIPWKHWFRKTALNGPGCSP